MNSMTLAMSTARRSVQGNEGFPGLLNRRVSVPLLGHGRAGHTRRYDVRPDAISCPFERKRLSEQWQGRPWWGSRLLILHAGLGRHRGGEACHSRGMPSGGIGAFREEPCTLEIDVEHPVPVGDGQVADLRGAGDAGVADQSVEASEGGHCLVDQPGRDVRLAESPEIAMASPTEFADRARATLSCGSDSSRPHTAIRASRPWRVQLLAIRRQTAAPMPRLPPLTKALIDHSSWQSRVPRTAARK